MRCRSVEIFFDGPVQAEATGLAVASAIAKPFQEDKQSRVEATSRCQSSQPVYMFYCYGVVGLSIYWRLYVYVIFGSCA